MDIGSETPPSTQTTPTLVLKHFKDIRTGPDGSIDILAQDETGGDIIIRIGADDLALIPKRLSNRRGPTVSRSG